MRVLLTDSQWDDTHILIVLCPLAGKAPVLAHGGQEGKAFFQMLVAIYYGGSIPTVSAYTAPTQDGLRDE